MSLSRTALRLAVVEALSPYAQNVAATPVWPTFAAGQVFDSQNSPDVLHAIAGGKPVIVVSVDGGKTEAQGSASDVTLAGAGLEKAALAFEIHVPVAVRGESGEAVFDIGPTDAAAKAFLELIEDQILQRLAEARMNGPLRHVLVTIGEVESQPYSDADAGVLLSATRLELTCTIRQRESWPAAGATGLDRLPAPLRDVAKALHAESYGGQIAAGLAEILGNPALFPDLNEIRLAANLARAAGDAAPPAANAAPTPPVGDVAGTLSP
ncbi:hypothetical protein ABIE41_003862 [Bosea sp. OAE506]|uniref:hypothetical protein n=1 Tax=Bosea sp. OAE506 TaxID=2663870 RepID=UPI00178A3343